MKIEHLDHLVLTVADLDKTIDFYQRVMGFGVVTFKGDRKALTFGQQKINLHLHGHEFEPKALLPAPGTADLCFISSTPLEQVQSQLHRHGVDIEKGPVECTGAQGTILSVYVRDPDNNLIEISNYMES